MESKYTNEPECDTTFQDIKTIQSTQSVHTGNGNSAQNSISVPIVEISSVMENKNIQSGRKMSIEKSASHSELPKENKLDPKYMSTQTLPEQTKKKKRNLFSSIKKFLTKKKSKSIGKCESTLFADKSLQNIYSDTWNQRQFDEQMKRATFDDELFETFRKSKLDQVESFIQNEQEAQAANNFNYLKNIGSESESLKEEIVSNVSSEEVVKEATYTDNGKTGSERTNEPLTESPSEVASDKLTETDRDTSVEDIKNKTSTVSLEDMRTSSEEQVTVEESTPIVVGDIKISTEQTNKSNSSSLERRRNNNSQPIQVMLDNSEHPCGDIIVHVDSDNSSESVGHIGTSEESSPELHRHKKEHDTTDKNIDQTDGDDQLLLDSNKNKGVDISDQERALIITEIDKIFEDEGLNITFESSASGTNNETIHDLNEGSNKTIRLSNNFSLPSTLDRRILITKQEQIHKKNIGRRSNQVDKAENSKDNFNSCDSDDQERSDNENNGEETAILSNESEDISIDPETEAISEKIVDKFDVAKIDMQKSFLVPGASSSSESSKHVIPDDIEKTSSSLEEYVLRTSLRHKTLKPKNSVATANFSVNPIFTQDVEDEKIVEGNLVVDTANGRNLPEINDDNSENILELSVPLRENGTSTPENSFLDPEYSFHLRKTPESGYSSTVETARGTTPDLTTELRKVSECEEFVVAPRMSEEQELPPNENLEEVEGGKNIADMKIDVSTNKYAIDEKYSKSSIGAETVESKQPETVIQNKALLEPGIILDERIVLERRNILSHGSPSSSSRNNLNIRTNTDLEKNVVNVGDDSSKANTIDLTDSSNGREDLNQVSENQSEPTILNDHKNELTPTTNLGVQLRAEFEKLSHVFSRSVENLTAENTGSNNSNSTSDKCTVEQNNLVKDAKRFSQEADAGIVPYDHLKELSNARNAMHYNTRL